MPLLTAPVRRGFLLLAIAVTAWLQISSPARGDIVGDGRPVSTVWCESRAGADLLVAQMRVAMPDAPLGCHHHHFSPAYPTVEMLAEAELIAGPFSDFMGDTFAVFRIENGAGYFFPFIWWGGPRFSPIGMKI